MLNYQVPNYSYFSIGTQIEWYFIQNIGLPNCILLFMRYLLDYIKIIFVKQTKHLVDGNPDDYLENYHHFKNIGHRL